MTEQDYIKEQIKLGKKINRNNTIDLTQIKSVVGVDYTSTTFLSHSYT